MKKKDSAGLGMTIPKRMRIAGMTFYLRNGQLIGRESSTHEKRSNTLPQFIQPAEDAAHDGAVEDAAVLRRDVH